LRSDRRAACNERSQEHCSREGGGSSYAMGHSCLAVSCRACSMLGSGRRALPSPNIRL
jgi:hypothetical protein